jgi:glucosamine--fructose-6-phosphate aminotransferase (isomerizing)
MFGGTQFEMVLLVARGSSDNAALFARYLMEVHLRIPAVLAAPSVLTRYGARVKYPKALAVGISQSGAAPDVAEVLGAMRQDGHGTLAITNTRGSKITQVAEHTLDLGLGSELSVAATKTYTASLMALYALVRALGGHLPCFESPDDSWLEEARAAAEQAAGPTLRMQHLFCVARGYRFSSAQETALKLMECALLPCKSYSTADFEHGPKALATHGTAVLVFGEPPKTVSAEGAESILAPQRNGVREEMLPVWDALFGQWLALLAARARGLDPDHAHGLSKVTKTF